MLSQAEKDWVAAHPVVHLGMDPNYGPYSFTGDMGQMQGVVREFLPHIERSLGIRFKIGGNMDWSRPMEAIEQHRIDAVAGRPQPGIQAKPLSCLGSSGSDR